MFADFFIQKIVGIRSNLYNVSENDYVFSKIKAQLSCQLKYFEPLSVDDVLHEVLEMPSKTCSLNPIGYQEKAKSPCRFGTHSSGITLASC